MYWDVRVLFTLPISYVHVYSQLYFCSSNAHTSRGWSKSPNQRSADYMCNFSSQLRTAQVTLGFSECQHWSPWDPRARFYSKNNFRLRLMHLKRVVYRAAAFNLTLIKNFKCSYRNWSDKPKQHLVNWLQTLPANPSPTLLLWAKVHDWPT
jgi:hypothetical protein